MFARYLAAIAMAAAFSAQALPAHAQGNYPAKPVRLIVPFPPGQATDIVARLLADGLSRAWGQQVIVDNRGGGGSIPGMMAGRDAPADGHTITFGTSGSLGVNPSLYSKLPYDPPKDFAMVNGVFIVPLMIVAHPGLPYNTLGELIDAAKKEPGKLNIGYAGTGTSQHLTGELFKVRAGIDIVGITYKGSGPAVTDLLGGQIPLLVDSLASALPHIKSGKIKALAMTTLQRVPQLPDVPTVAELGYPGFEGVGWGGLIVPKGTPNEIVEKIGADVRQVLNDPVMRQRIIDRGAIPDARGPKEWTEFVNAEIVKWGEVVRRAGLKAD
jgi:tripartite-type tricarboxylate transporter receptor subunit TctC